MSSLGRRNLEQDQSPITLLQTRLSQCEECKPAVEEREKWYKRTPSEFGIYIRALSAPVVRGVESHGHVLEYIRAHILVIVSLRVCNGPQQTRVFSSELATKRKYQQIRQGCGVRKLQPCGQGVCVPTAEVESLKPDILYPNDWNLDNSTRTLPRSTKR